MLKSLLKLLSAGFKNESTDITGRKKYNYFLNIKGNIQHPQSLKCHGTVMPPKANCTMDEWMDGAYSKMFHK